MEKKIILEIKCSIDKEFGLTYSINCPETLSKPLHQLVDNSLNSLVEDYISSFLLESLDVLKKVGEKNA